MSEHLSPRDPTSFDRSFSGLSSTVRAIVSEVVSPRDRSFPAALCTIAGEVAATTAVGTDPPTATGGDGDGDGNTDPNTALTFDEREGPADEILTSVADAVTLLEGYVRLRSDLCDSDRYDDRERRDAAVLASDHLHAAAYATITDVPVPDRRSLELYRQLAAGSSALAAGFAERTPAEAETETGREVAPENRAASGSAPRERPSELDDELARPCTVLAETAATLGTTAVGAADETRAAMNAYARSLSAALWRTVESRSASRSGTGSEPGSGSASKMTADAIDTDGDPRETAARVLSGRARASPSSDGATRSSPAAARHVERAREALSPLVSRSEAEAGTDETEDETETPTPSPLARLERATRIPFENER
ncbi:hypothetical protein [Halopiger thermotolerans]